MGRPLGVKNKVKESIVTTEEVEVSPVEIETPVKVEVSPMVEIEKVPLSKLPTSVNKVNITNKCLNDMQVDRLLIKKGTSVTLLDTVSIHVEKTLQYAVS